MIRIEIEDPTVRVIKYTNKAGQPAELRAQEAYLFTLDAQGVQAKYPDKFEFLLERDQSPFGKGVYALGPDAVFVDGTKKLRISPRFLPAVERTQPAAKVAA